VNGRPPPEKALLKFIDILIPTIKKLEKLVKVQVLFVNNGSTDRSFDILLKQDESFKCLGILTLTRNFGYEAALIAGLENSISDVYVLIDADGEDSPEIILDFYESILLGNSVAVGIRGKRVESFSTAKFRQFSYRFLSKISDDSFVANAGNFAMFTKVVRDSIILENKSFPFLRATISRAGFQTKFHPYDRNRRLDGISKYRKLRLIKFAIAGFLTTTTWPLRLISYLVIFTIPAIISLGLISFIYSSTSLFLITLLIMSFEILFATAIIALYLARVYKDILGRPIYYIDETKSWFDKTFNLIRS
jgi:dolichol-phosphate mannosyltransferase